jgi:hypothetical protein
MPGPAVVIPVKCAETGSVVLVEVASPYHEDRSVDGPVTL